MRKNVRVRAGRSFIGLIFVAGLLSGGCDSGSNKTEMVKPDVAPEISGKSSMDAYKADSKAAHTPGKK
jgi:hypothetical protein